jgi:acetate kinase
MAESIILAVNAGSSSLKIGVFDAHTGERLRGNALDWRGGEGDVENHIAGLERLLADVDCSTVAGIGHRVVQGGTRLRESVIVDDAVTSTIAELSVLAPLHNRAALDGIEACRRMFPGVPQVATFDTAFHATLPPVSYRYPIPAEWHDRWGIRRLGFHGLSHAYCAARATELLGSRPGLRFVSCHLGQGCSITAIVDGRSQATTMGFTPMDGIMMGSRSGAIDPGIVTYLLNHQGMTATDIEHALNYESGLLGVSGLSADMREIVAARASGHPRATLAFDLFVARLRDGIMAMAAAMQGFDGVIFTGGIGAHSADVRAAVCAQLEWVGVCIDEAKNLVAEPDCIISLPDSTPSVLVIQTDEELMVARETRRVLAL